MRRNLIVTGVFEAFALILASVQAMGGVRTDEAKYLLNIPYPHPPVFRSILNATDWLPFQEMFWRILLASLLAQAVWLVWHLSRGLPDAERFGLSGVWLLSAALLLQAGSIMIAPVTALQLLILIYLYFEWNEESNSQLLARRSPQGEVGSILNSQFFKVPEWRALALGLFWLAMLFTSYQAVLFFPLVWVLFRRNGTPFETRILYVFGPLLCLAVYTVWNPLAAGTILGQADAGTNSLLGRTWEYLKVWMIGGGLIGSIVGTWGIIASRRWSLLLTFILLSAFVLASVQRQYYAILFTPLFVAGTHLFFRNHMKLEARPFLPVLVAASVVLVFLFPPSLTPSPARAVMRAIAAQNQEGNVLLNYDYGHEWQYESRVPVLRYRSSLRDEAQAIVCEGHCDQFSPDEWKVIDVPDVDVEVWVRRQAVPSDAAGSTTSSSSAASVTAAE